MFLLATDKNIFTKLVATFVNRLYFCRTKKQTSMENTKFNIDGITVEAHIERHTFNEDFEGGQVQQTLTVTVYDAAGEPVTDADVLADAERWALVHFGRSSTRPASSKDIFEREREYDFFERISDELGEDYILFTE